MTYKKFLGVIALWTAVLALPELVARLFLPQWAPAQENARTLIPDPDVGWLYRPGAEADTARLSGTFIANAQGLREKEVGAKTKPRVLFLGDSFTWGWGVPNGVRYTDRLQQRYPQWETFNAGVNGYSTVQESLLLEKYRAVIQPDLVVIQIFHNDFADNLEAQAAYKKPYLDWREDFELKNHPVVELQPSLGIRALLWIADHTWFYRQLVLAGYVLLVKSGFEFSQEERIDPPSEQELLAKGMEIALARLGDYCVQQKIPLYVFSSDLEPWQRDVVDRFAAQYRLRHDDLTQKVFAGQKDFDLGDHTGHWNERGHQWVADYLGPVIEQQLRPQ